MALKIVFRKFIGSVLGGMEKEVAGKDINLIHRSFKFEWKKLGYHGAKDVAELLKEIHQLKASPKVVEGGEEPISLFSVSHERVRHEFMVGETKYSYVQVGRKAKTMFKDFSALSTQFWVDFDRKKANAKKRETRIRDDKSYERYLEIQKEKKKKEEEEAEKKRQEEEEKEKKEKEEAEKKKKEKEEEDEKKKKEEAEKKKKEEEEEEAEKEKKEEEEAEKKKKKEEEAEKEKKEKEEKAEKEKKEEEEAEKKKKEKEEAEKKKKEEEEEAEKEKQEVEEAETPPPLPNGN